MIENINLLSPCKTFIISVSDYKYVHACDKNKTHIDFYLIPPVPGERGQPTVIFIYKTKKERDVAFNRLIDMCGVEFL